MEERIGARFRKDGPSYARILADTAAQGRLHLRVVEDDPHRLRLHRSPPVASAVLLSRLGPCALLRALDGRWRREPPTPSSAPRAPHASAHARDVMARACAEAIERGRRGGDDAFHLTPQEPDTRSRCPDCRGSGLALLDTDPPSPTEAMMDGERWITAPGASRPGTPSRPRARAAVWLTPGRLPLLAHRGRCPMPSDPPPSAPATPPAASGRCIGCGPSTALRGAVRCGRGRQADGLGRRGAAASRGAR